MHPNNAFLPEFSSKLDSPSKCRGHDCQCMAKLTDTGRQGHALVEHLGEVCKGWLGQPCSSTADILSPPSFADTVRSDGWRGQPAAQATAASLAFFNCDDCVLTRLLSSMILQCVLAGVLVYAWSTSLLLVLSLLHSTAGRKSPKQWEVR